MHWDLLVPQGVIRIHTAFPTLLSGYERQHRHISERSSNMMMQTLEASASFLPSPGHAPQCVCRFRTPHLNPTID